MYKTLANQRWTPKPLRYKPCGVIMGQTGAGKTTLSNKLCGTTHKSGAAKGSVTQGIYRNDVNCGYSAFSLIDTPGTDSSTETYKHAILLREALTATETNSIFLIMKYNNRFDKLLDNYFEIVQPVFKYARKTAVMISHMDVSENPEQDFNQICELFAEECPDVANILFFSDKSSEIEITQFMYTCMANMEAETLTISDEEFQLNFNVYQMRNEIKAAFNQYQRSVGSIETEYAELIPFTNETESVEERDEILHMMIVEFKNEVEGLYQNFIQTHGGAMHQLDYYVFAIKMQKENVRICDEFVKRIVPLMSYNLYDSKDIRNLIKRCPNCTLIWYKTEGCDGATTCGNRVSSYWDVSPTVVFKYVMTKINGKRQIQKNAPSKKAVLEKRPSASGMCTPGVSCKPGREFESGVGCGNKFVWGNQPKLEDHLILELFKVKTIAEAVELIKSQDFQRAHASYEKNIDKGFYF